ncbi:MAG: hypothetical protein L3J49_07550 [Desulfobulbaceae bacterium]|nr:hypothetical protein [Desulfobulbaceae bacterium]
MLETNPDTAPSLIGFDDIKTQPIEGWEEFLHEGEAYLKTGHGAYARRREVFTPEILYNIIAMAIEKFVMAALMKYGALPYNHTMGDLVEAMEETFPGALGEIREKIIALDRYQEICDVDAFMIRPPKRKEIAGMLEIAAQLQNLIHALIREKTQ